MDETTTPPAIASGIESIRRRWPAVQSPSAEEPIFVLAAGWRSGSTLLQRLLMPRAFVWGEPFGHAGLIEDLARPLAAFSAAWPPDGYFYGGEPAGELAERFVANLYPDPQSLLDAHLAYFERLLIEPARRAADNRPVAQKTRWGLKEVRLSVDHAAYLKWLFPRAKLLFLIRNPWDAYRSYAARGQQWFLRWPDQPLTPKTFARHWRMLAASFVDQAERLGAHLVRYEALSRGEYAPIEEYLGFELHRAAADVNPEAHDKRPLETLSESAMEVLCAELGGVPERLGYAPPGPAAKPAMARGPAPREKCVVLVPAMNAIEPRCDEALRGLEARGYTVRRLYGRSQIDYARSQMASDALADGFEATMWIDADMAFEPGAVDRLREHALPLVCGIYAKRGPRSLSCRALPGTERIVFGLQGGLIEILYAATGFLLVHTQVYRDMQHQLGLPWCNQRFGRPMMAPYFLPLIQCDDAGHWYLSEDYSFCERARQCGYRVWADTTIRLGHIGQYLYQWEDAGSSPPRYDSYLFDLQ